MGAGPHQLFSWLRHPNVQHQEAYLLCAPGHEPQEAVLSAGKHKRLIGGGCFTFYPQIKPQGASDDPTPACRLEGAEPGGSPGKLSRLGVCTCG